MSRFSDAGCFLGPHRIACRGHNAIRTDFADARNRSTAASIGQDASDGRDTMVATAE
jgi:hypothetical protein